MAIAKRHHRCKNLEKADKQAARIQPWNVTASFHVCLALSLLAHLHGAFALSSSCFNVVDVMFRHEFGVSVPSLPEILNAAGDGVGRVVLAGQNVEVAVDGECFGEAIVCAQSQNRPRRCQHSRRRRRTRCCSRWRMWHPRRVNLQGTHVAMPPGLRASIPGLPWCGKTPATRVPRKTATSRGPTRRRW